MNRFVLSFSMMNYTLDWLKTKINSGDPVKYIFFWGHTNNTSAETGKFVFSQWFPSPFTVDEITYKTAEHWMMAHKAKLFGDKERFHCIIAAHKPSEVKELGRQILNFDENEMESVRIRNCKSRKHL